MLRTPALAVGLLSLTALGCADRPSPDGDSAAVALSPSAFTFTVIGDTPYEPQDVELFPALVEDLNASDPPFVIHVGDIKAGGDPCTDDMILGRAAMYEAFTAPFIYTPGDNEWADCHRSGRVPLERLSFLREVFYAEGRFDSPPGLESQSASTDPSHSAFVENQRWSVETSRGPILFATAHIVGSDNAREDFDGRIAADDGEVDRRDSANAAWLDETFALALRDSAAAVVIAAHADVRFGRDISGPFDSFRQALRRGVEGFSGPVVLLQGDTHSCLFDQPGLGPGGNPYPNFWRFRVAGGGNQVGWFEVTVDPGGTGDGRVRVEAHMIRGICRL